MRSRVMMLAAFLAVALAVWVAFRSSGPEGPKPIATVVPGSEAIYMQYCGEACHGPDGRMVEGVTNPVQIGGQDFLATVDDETLFGMIKRGRPGENGRGHPGTKMTGFGIETEGGPPPILTDAQIRDVVSYLRSWQTQASVEIEAFDASSGDAAAGADTYVTNCAACHGDDGWGALGPRMAGTTFQDLTSDALIRHVVLNGRSNTSMPSFKQFDDTEMADLIAFIRGLDDA
jgi:mono/diheme cytochrome c family protein